jgi:hypothetical protein
MAQPNKYDKQHLRNLGLTEKQIEGIFNLAVKEAAAIGVSIHDFNPDKPFSFDDYPMTKKRIDKAIRKLQKNVETAIVNGVRSGWTLANNKNNVLCDRVFGDNKYRLTKEQERRYYSNNDKALEAFIERKTNGLNLSDRVWKYSDQFKNEIEMGLDLGIRNGLPAAEIARDLKQYLQYPDKLFRRVRDEHGQLHLSKAAKDFHPGAGVSRSSFKNARRLAVTETNIAYRTSDHTLWQKLDFVVGIEIRLSNNHTLNGKPFTDICDDLKGKYPKTFKFTGWHPLCYDELSEVYTDRGWQFFRDVDKQDKILSINTETYNLEWANIVLQEAYPYAGSMAHFFNRSLDILVTPEHEMLVLSKQDAKTFRRIEARKCGKTQPIYRSCNWKGVHRENININGLEISFNLFCRFMGYWLADGSLGHKYEISIAQQDENRLQIYDCIAAMNLKPRFNSGKVEVNCRELYDYLKPFRRCYSKYIPDVIKEAVPYQIKIFLDTFISCDGRIKSPKSFTGNRGSLCSPSECQRIYYTSSVRMADDIGELILKIGMRPSFRVQRLKGKRQTFKNGIYTINHDGIIISECSSKTATQYSKEFVPYSGTVYDLTLDRNNTMYIRRNGKCFWGSNCRCHAISILKTEDELMQENEAIMEGREPDKHSVNEVKDVPEGFTKWIEKNAGRIQAAEKRGTLPYFIKDNYKDGNINNRFVWQSEKRIKTEAEKTDILKRWEERKKHNVAILKEADEVLNAVSDFPEIDAFNLSELIKSKQINKIKIEKDKIAKMVSEAEKEESRLSELIPDVKKWKAQFGVEKVQTVYNAVEKKVQSFENLPLADQIEKLKFEIKWVADNKKYDTWGIAQDAYKKQLAKVEYKKMDSEIDLLINNAKSLNPKANSKLAGLLKNKVVSQGYIDKVTSEMDALIARRNKSPQAITFPELTKKEIESLLSKFGNETIEEKDGMLRGLTEKIWGTLTLEERNILTKYTQTYNYLNERLRGIPYSGPRTNAEYAHDLPVLTKALAKFKMPEATVVRRGVDNFTFKELGYDLSQLKKGDVFTDKAFLSTSIHKDGGFQLSYNFVIVVPKGAQGFYAEPFSHYTDALKFNFADDPKKANLWEGKTKEAIRSEQEWIGQRGCKFKVLKKTGKTIYMQLIGQLQ